MKKVMIWFFWCFFVICSRAYAIDFMLPYEGGSTWLCTQGWNGTVSHYGAWEYSWDFAVPEGDPVLSVADGTVVFVGPGLNSQSENVLGNTVIINFGGGVYGKYCHLLNTTEHPLLVEVNDVVSRGQVIGYCGSTGTSSTGPHIHFNALTLKAVVMCGVNLFHLILLM